MTTDIVDSTYTVEATVIVDGVDLAPGQYLGRKVRVRAGSVILDKWEYRIDTNDYSDLHCDEQIRDGTIKILV